MWREIQSCLRQGTVPSVGRSSSSVFVRVFDFQRLQGTASMILWTSHHQRLKCADNIDLTGCQLSQKIGSSEGSIVCGIRWPVHQGTTVDPLLSLSLHCTLPLMILSVIQNSNKSTKTNQPKVMLWPIVFLETFSLWRTIYHDYKEQNM